MRERHWILHNSIGALPSEVKALFWVHVLPFATSFVFLAILILNMILYYLYNEKFHPLAPILHSIETDVEMRGFKIAETAEISKEELNIPLHKGPSFSVSSPLLLNNE